MNHQPPPTDFFFLFVLFEIGMMWENDDVTDDELEMNETRWINKNKKVVNKIEKNGSKLWWSEMGWKEVRCSVVSMGRRRLVCYKKKNEKKGGGGYQQGRRI